MLVLFSGTTFCGNSPVDPSLLTLVQNEVMQLSSNWDDFVWKDKEEKDLLESKILEVKQSLNRTLERIDLEVQTLKQKVADLSSLKIEQSAKLPRFFGALDRNEYFTGRVKELETLENAFEEVNKTPDVHGVARRKGNVRGICGLGGCGKSSLAFEYSWRNLDRYPGGIFVVNGESDDLMRESLQRIHEEFVESTQFNQEKEAKPFEKLLIETLSWFGNRRDKWLLLVDNMDQKELSPCARKMFLGQWKSKASGDILVTSRRMSQALCEDLDIPSQNCVELDPFSVDESIEFLKKRTGIPFICDEQDRGGKELAQELGGLPLALEQAAAYIKALKCSIQSYLQQYRSQYTLLNAKSAKPCTEIYSETRLAVQTTWPLNFSYILNDERDQGLGKAAAFFMKITAFLSPDEIPISILNIGAPEIENMDLKKRLEMPIGAEQIVELLVRFSLFKRNSADTLSVHRLVQETLRNRCDGEGETDEVLFSALRMMHRVFLDCVGATDFFFDLYNKVESLVMEKQSHLGQFIQFVLTSATVPLEAKLWKKLSVNAFHLVCNLLKDSPLKPRFFSEESARIFCESAFYCYSLGMENLGYSLQQFVFEIICAIKEPRRYYIDDDLRKVTRILRPCTDSALFSMELMGRSGLRGKVSERKDVPVGTTQTEELLETMKVIAPRAKEAFGRGDFQTSADLYSEIVKIANFNSFRGSFRKEDKHAHLVPLGEIFCFRGIAHLQMSNFETAVDDFNSCTRVDIHYYRGYYWKAYALCKLAQSGGTEFISRAQAAMAVLQFKFAHSKSDDIRKLKKTFPGLLDRIEYRFVSQVSELKELERLSRVRHDFSGDSLTIILGDGHFDLKEISLLGGRYYFICPPGSSATLNCVKGLYLEEGSFLFENVSFQNPYTFIPAVASCTPLGELCPAMTSSKNAKEVFATDNFDTLTLGRPHPTEIELTAGNERKLSALIEANDVHSLVIDHCNVTGPLCTGIAINFSNSCIEQRSVSVRSSKITSCNKNGIQVQSNSPLCDIVIQDNHIVHNLYGIVIASPSRFCLENNYIFSNNLSGVVAISAVDGRLVRNSVVHNGKHGILLNKTNAVMEENTISNNHGWGIVCSFASNLHCNDGVLESNLCGGLRTIYNGKGRILVERCEFRENFGPAVYPAGANERCQMELKWRKAFTASREVRVPFYADLFLDGTSLNWESTRESKTPEQADNRVSDISEKLFDIELDFCCTCCEELQMGGKLIECSSCHIAKYCGMRCFDTAKAFHDPVCKSILEANKEIHMNCDVLNLTLNEAGISLCVIAAITLAPFLGPLIVDFDRMAPVHLCLLWCPRRNLCVFINSTSIHYFVLKRGIHLPDRMMDIKAACILANFEPESRAVTVYKHRIFPLEKVPDALKWVDEALHLFEEEYFQSILSSLFASVC